MLSSTNHIRLIAFLKEFGCNSREATIYLECLQLGAVSVQEIAHKTNSNRITIHSAIQQLIKKGLLVETRKGKKRLIAPEHPEVLYRILQKRKNELQSLEMNLDVMTKLLNSIQSSDKNLSTFRIYDGIDGVKKMLEETLDAKGEVCVFSAVELFPQLLGDAYLENYYARRAEKGIHSRIIYPLCNFTRKIQANAVNYKVQMRLLADPYRHNASVYLWNNNIALKSIRENKIICTIIENEDLAHFFHHIIFEIMWNNSPPLTVENT